MQIIEMWPDEIEVGDAVLDDIVNTYLRFVDRDSGIDVRLMLTPEAYARMQPQLRAVLAHIAGNTEGQSRH